MWAQDTNLIFISFVQLLYYQNTTTTTNTTPVLPRSVLTNHVSSSCSEPVTRSRDFPRRPVDLVRASPKYRLRPGSAGHAGIPAILLPSVGSGLVTPSADHGLPAVSVWPLSVARRSFVAPAREPGRVTSRRGSERNPGKLPALATSYQTERSSSSEERPIVHPQFSRQPTCPAEVVVSWLLPGRRCARHGRHLRLI